MRLPSRSLMTGETSYLPDEARGQRNMIRHARPRTTVMCVRLLDREAAHVDSIEVQHRKNGREAARGAASGCFEYLVDVQRLHHRVACHPAPVVEIAGDDQWRILGHQLVDAILDQGDLLLAPMSEQSKVHIDAMERVRPSGYRDF